ncbi:hypothetical protein [Kitasatospora sp. NPDC088783]|uniref:hypothetical protein n=1 Tax=Kitasatospora sp. NPDC088783 TaxID=3364077 RepID=UPI00380C2CF7
MTRAPCPLAFLQPVTAHHSQETPVADQTPTERFASEPDNELALHGIAVRERLIGGVRYRVARLTPGDGTVRLLAHRQDPRTRAYKRVHDLTSAL